MSAFGPDSNAEPTTTPPLRTDILIAVAVGGLGAAATIWFTAQGMDTFNDSATYLSVAQHLTSGKGITAAAPYTNSQLSIPAQLSANGQFPMSGWPPGYPLILAAFMQFGASATQAARIISVIGGTTLAAAMFLGARRVFHLGRPTSVALTALAAWAPNVAAVDLGAMSGRGVIAAESVFLPLGLVTVLCGIVALKSTSSRWIVVTCVLIAACTLVRATGPIYGLVLLVGAILTWRDADVAYRRRRVALGLVFLATGVATTVAWSVINQLLYDPSSGVRHLGWYGMSGVTAIALQVTAGWFGVPWTESLVLPILMVLAAVTLPVFVVLHPRIRRQWWNREEAKSSALVTTAIAIIATIGVILVTCVLLDRTLLPDARHLAPAQPLAYLLGASVLTKWLAGRRTTSKKPAIAASQASTLACSAVVLCAIVSTFTIPLHRPTGGMHDKASSAMAALGVLPVTTRIVTNAPDELWLRTGRTSLVLPPHRYFTTMRPNPNFETDLARIGELAHQEPLVVVVSPAIPYPAAGALALLRARDGFVRVVTCAGGLQVWAVPGTKGAVFAGRLGGTGQGSCSTT